MPWRRALVTGLITATAAGSVVLLWLTVGGNTAGWITTFIVAWYFIFLPEFTPAEHWFKGLTKRGQTITMSVPAALTLAGGIVYVLLPGTAAWYLCGFPALPLVVMLGWLRDDPDTAGASGGGFSDGPWTAP